LSIRFGVRIIDELLLSTLFNRLTCQLNANAHSLLLALLACAGRRARRSLGRTAHAEWRRTLSITCVITQVV
jgi:hypothetical protein